MKQKITSVEMKDPSANGDGTYTVVKVIREMPDTPGETVSPVPARVEFYKGEDRAAAKAAHDAAQREMFA